MNGVLSPPLISEPATTSINLSSKRKRDDNILDSENAALPAMSTAESLTLITDLVDVLKVDDTTPSILTRPLSNKHSMNGSQSKRPKTEDIGESKTSILSRLSTKAYSTVHQVLKDIDLAAQDILESNGLSNSITSLNFPEVSTTRPELKLRITAFKKKAHDLVKRERESWNLIQRAKSNVSRQTNLRMSATDGFPETNSSSLGSRLVLTLFGNAPTPKQLFSGLQIPTKINDGKDEVIDSVQEDRLPLGITTTRIIKTNSFSKKRTQTLGELFPIPSTVIATIPPKPSKITTTRSTNVGWYCPESLDLASQAPSYFTQEISCGVWIDYGKVSSSSQSTKAKHREKIKSLRNTKAHLLDTDSIESNSSNIEALFRSAYSSFAPTTDDTASIAPVGLLNRVWWQEIGKKSYGQLIEDTETNYSPDELENEKFSSNKNDNDLDVFEKGLEEIENLPIDPNLESEHDSERPCWEREVTEILESISELLEVLTSYQRVRHLSLNSPNRSASLIPATDTNLLGTPLKPSDSEQSIYEILKSQLIMMIAALPPYAVAKLSPDRLADLGISTKLEVKVNDNKGVMEEDEFISRSKVTAASNTSNTNSRISTHRNGNGNATPSSHYGSQYASSQSRSSLTHYNSAQSLAGSPGTTSAPYQPQRTSSAAPYRPTSYSGLSHPNQTPRTVQQQYTQSGQQPPYLQSGSGQNFLRGSNQNFHQPPNSQANRYSGKPYQNQVQSSNSNSDYSRSVGSHQISRQISPQKQPYSPTANTGQNQTTHSSSIPSISQSSQLYAISSLGSTARSPYSQQSTNLGSAQPYSTFMTHEQQQSMIQRQQAAMASQKQSAQDQARNTAHSPTNAP
ncbi:Bgt-3803 [Blumeria graminis f. sp. tritici]|uniref:Bgt-3803 n=2 Tax=Blumeria graminis f. sp. tritici TaxID=62690 RepID=A0A061HJU3_BLUGR|nr:hypothetical protein BGT96224_3803 [Blumeria graminis f. sp. tritici 96224]VDB88992.1 Bgt-3803 [Blumeria graminis f. sp. tritici]